MREQLYQTVRNFLFSYHKKGDPLLLGFSGGVDSLTLFHLLLEYKKNYELDLHVAHLDHGWREESLQETLFLKDYVERFQIPFHTLRLEKTSLKNLEEQGRELRLEFFFTLFSQFHFEALLLAHHADDQAETVLKRVFEGANLINLGGLRPITTIGGIEIWRPLLSIKKEELRRWAEKRNFHPLEDSTNFEKRFLRGKMRTTLLPFLEEQFGKKISKNLCHLSEEIHSLREYLKKKTTRFREKIVFFKDQKGWELDFNSFYPLEQLEIKAFFKEILKKELLSREQLRQVTEALLKKKTYILSTKKSFFEIEKGKIQLTLKDLTQEF